MTGLLLKCNLPDYKIPSDNSMTTSHISRKYEGANAVLQSYLLKKFMDNYFENNIDKIRDINYQLTEDFSLLYNKSCIEKALVLSLLSTVKLFFQ